MNSYPTGTPKPSSPQQGSTYAGGPARDHIGGTPEGMGALVMVRTAAGPAPGRRLSRTQ